MKLRDGRSNHQLGRVLQFCGGGLLTDAFVDFGEAEGLVGDCQSVESAEGSFDFVIGERVEIFDADDVAGIVVEDVGHGEGGGGGFNTLSNNEGERAKQDAARE